VWPLVSNDWLVWGHHLDALCDHLQSVVEGRIANLLVTGGFLGRFTFFSPSLDYSLTLPDPYARAGLVLRGGG
jgi:hypothetical protein